MADDNSENENTQEPTPTPEFNQGLGNLGNEIFNHNKRSEGVAIFLILLLVIFSYLSITAIGNYLIPLLVGFCFIAYYVEFLKPITYLAIGIMNLYYSMFVTVSPGFNFLVITMLTALMFFLLLPEELLLFPLVLLFLDLSASIFIFNPISVLMFIPSMLYIISAKWFILGIFSYFTQYSQLKEKINANGKPYNTTIYSIISLLIFIILIGLVAPTLYYRYSGLISLSISPTQISKYLDLQKEVQAQAKDIANQTKSSSARFFSAFGCLLKGDLACYNKLMKPDKEVVSGEIGLGQQTYIHFNKVTYLQDKFLEKQPIVMASNLKVVDLKNSISKINFTCNLTNTKATLTNTKSNKSKTNPLKMDVTPSKVNIQDFDGYFENDIYCKNSQGLVNGTYRVKMNADVSNIKTTSKITNLLMDKDGLDSLLKSYISANKLSYSTITRNDLIRKVFSSQINAIYPSGSVVSQAEQGNLLKLNLKTRDNFIVGISSNHPELNTMLLKSSITNNGKGTAHLKKVEFIYILPSFSSDSNISTCKNEDLNIELKKGKTYSFNPCILKLNPAWVENNKNSPTSIDIQMVVTYEYDFENTMYFEVVPLNQLNE